jgi:hypothetical protein
VATEAALSLRGLRLQVLMPAAVAAVYCLPRAFADPPLAQYIARGILGCLYALALWLGLRISGATCACIVAWEGSTSLCGLLYSHVEAFGAMCDSGSGLPWTYPSLAVTLAATIIEGGRGHG